MQNSNNTSWRHHYLPQFYIRKFYHRNRKLWIFDKKENKILKTPKPSKSIFFERDRNSINFNGETDDYIEKLFGKFDTDLAIRFNKINLRNKEELESDQDFIIYLYSFINWLYWRIPKFDELNERFIIENIEELKKYGEDLHPNLFASLNKEDKVKLYKATIPFLIMQKPFESGKKKFKYKIFENQNPIFLLADNPLIIRNHPMFTNSITNPVIIPISSNRLFFTLDNAFYQIDSEMIKELNLILMYNAKRYIASPNKQILEGFVRGYNVIKEIPNINPLIDRLFEKLNSKKKESEY